MDDTILSFNYPTDTPKIIKVLVLEAVVVTLLPTCTKKVYMMLHSFCVTPTTRH